MSPCDWIARCADRLRQLIHDEYVTDAELCELAADMAEDRHYASLEPAAAAEQHQQDYA
jgi:hypothetical protein